VRPSASMSIVALSAAMLLPASARGAFPVSDPGEIVGVSGIQIFDTIDYNGDGLVDLIGARGHLGGDLTVTLSLATPTGYAQPDVVTVAGA
jgi:hypothetical protein